MRQGKISQAVLGRSVLRVIKSTNPCIELGSGIGRDASVIIPHGKRQVFSTRSISVNSIKQLENEFVHMVNHIACAAGVAQAVMLSIVFPCEADEKLLKEIVKTIDQKCAVYNMQIMGGHTTVSKDVNVPVVTMTGTGFNDIIDFVPNAKPNQDIVITKWIALEGTSIVAEKYNEKLKKTLPNYLVDEAVRFGDYIDSSTESLEAYQLGASVVHDAAEGGIFAALWEFAYASGVGIEVDIKKIPVKQETVEVCECLHINPYEFLSTGSVIIAADNGEAICRQLALKNINAVVVGRTTDSNDRVIVNEDEVRHLTPACQDYIYNDNELK